MFISSSKQCNNALIHSKYAQNVSNFNSSVKSIPYSPFYTEHMSCDCTNHHAFFCTAGKCKFPLYGLGNVILCWMSIFFCSGEYACWPYFTAHNLKSKNNKLMRCLSCPMAMEQTYYFAFMFHTANNGTQQSYLT